MSVEIGSFIDPDYEIGNGLRDSCAGFESIITTLLNNKGKQANDSSVSVVHSARFESQCADTARELAHMVTAVRDLHLAIVESDAEAMPSNDLLSEDSDGASHQSDLSDIDACFSE